MFRIKPRISAGTFGLPGRRRDFRVQYQAKALRCQAITVSGRTMCRLRRQPGHHRDSKTHKSRSERRRRKRRGTFFWKTVATVLLKWKRLCPETSGNWVFPSPRTNRPYDSSSLRKNVLKPAAQRAKIQSAIGWHSLRHSYRAWLDDTGVPLGVQQKLMRHANISTTMNVYGGAFMDAKRRANTSVVKRILSQKQPK